jgi:hypothetical protein
MSNYKEWNKFLRQCYLANDIDQLLRIRRMAQVNMNELVKKKLADDKINNFFIRINRSIENTVKDIFKNKYPNPLDNPGTTKNIPKELIEKYKKLKEKRAVEIELAFKKYGY